MAAITRLIGVIGAAAVLSAGCTYADEEPGLSENHTTKNHTTKSPSVENIPPALTNPELPVAAEAEWTTAEGLQITTRFAIHAARRIQGATVVDWSVTPLSSPGYGRGDRLPSLADMG